jgi:uncharacterized membrane protein YkvA (DUF1232 family)
MSDNIDSEETIEDMHKGFKAAKTEAEEILGNKKETDKIINKSMSRAFKLRGGPLAQVWEDLQLLFSLMKDYTSGRYREIPVGSVIVILGGLIYLVNPIDIIPDIVPVLGNIDDVFIIGLVLSQVHADLQSYKEWKENN